MPSAPRSAMLRIDIAALTDGLHTLTRRVAPDLLDLDPAVFAEVVLELKLDVGDRRVLVAYDVSSVATLQCDRTLVDYEQPVRGSHAVLFVPPDRLPPEGEDEDVRALPDDATELDLTDAVRDTLLLALPLRRVAPEAEDAEIPTTFGAATDAEGHPVDDRWEALRRLRDDA